MSALTIPITTEFIELNQLLKLAGCAESGGAGGVLVTQGKISVDGQLETRKRCKIRPGQVVRIGSLEITVAEATPELMAEAKERAAKKAMKKAKAPWVQKRRKAQVKKQAAAATSPKKKPLFS